MRRTNVGPIPAVRNRSPADLDFLGSLQDQYAAQKGSLSQSTKGCLNPSPHAGIVLRVRCSFFRSPFMLCHGVSLMAVRVNQFSGFDLNAGLPEISDCQIANRTTLNAFGWR